MVWVNDKRIRDAQIGLLRAGFPTKIQILGRRKFAMIISLKKLQNTVHEHLGSYYRYEIYDASKPGRPILGIRAFGNFSTLKLEDLAPMIQKLERAGFPTEVSINDAMTMVDIKISLLGIRDIFVARGIPKKLFVEKLKVDNNKPFLILTFGR